MSFAKYIVLYTTFEQLYLWNKISQKLYTQGYTKYFSIQIYSYHAIFEYLKIRVTIIGDITSHKIIRSLVKVLLLFLKNFIKILKNIKNKVKFLQNEYFL